MIKKIYPPAPLEEDEQKTLVEYLELKKLRFTAIPNSTWTPSMAQKVKNKAMGLRSGLPDMILLLPDRILFLELKRVKGGVSSPAQQEWQEALNKIPNVTAVTCHGAGQAIHTIEEFLKK